MLDDGTVRYGNNDEASPDDYLVRLPSGDIVTVFGFDVRAGLWEQEERPDLVTGSGIVIRKGTGA